MRTVATLVFLAFFACVTTPALAEPPAYGTLVSINDSSVLVCDELEQIDTIVYADDPETAFKSFYSTLNAVGKPSCGYETQLTLLVLESRQLPGLITRDGHKSYAWGVKAIVVEVGEPFWFLYYQPIPEVPSSARLGL